MEHPAYTHLVLFSLLHSNLNHRCTFYRNAANPKIPAPTAPSCTPNCPAALPVSLAADAVALLAALDAEAEILDAALLADAEAPDAEAEAEERAELAEADALATAPVPDEEPVAEAVPFEAAVEEQPAVAGWRGSMLAG